MFHCGNNGAKYYCKACLPTKKSCTMTEPLSLMQVLLLGGNLDPYQLGAHFVAALLNAEMGYTKDVLTVPAVKNMFNEWDMNGCYEPSAGIQWYAEDIVRYLQTTMK
jgi:hypothetical protein